MARIAGVDIPREKKVAYSLCYIHGIGLTLANKICQHAKIDEDKRVKELNLNNDYVVKRLLLKLFRDPK